MSDYGMGVGGGPAAAGARRVAAEALSAAAEGRWAEAAGRFAELTGVVVDETVLRDAVGRVARCSGTAEAAVEVQAGLLAESVREGLVAVEVFFEPPADPFARAAPRAHEGWDDALACLVAIRQGDMEGALAWAAWVCEDERLGADVLCAAVEETARSCGVAAGAAVADLAAYLSDRAVGDLAVLSRWKDVLITRSRGRSAESHSATVTAFVQEPLA
ncbi:hypothetical protein [Streptomyces sp. NPDC051014]|uniref:hypothetical protein n=1 Tax=Streptomyces sp. NPDC051014 TaxID=3155751 RepID=UPI00340174F6